jgi:hypothetical protein
MDILAVIMNKLQRQKGLIVTIWYVIHILNLAKPLAMCSLQQLNIKIQILLLYQVDNDMGKSGKAEYLPQAII